MRKRKWSEYNKHLVQQGSISFLIDSKFFRAMHKSRPSKGPGRPLLFSDKLIEMLVILKIRFRLAYRALEGFAKSFFRGPFFHVPTYSLICKRVAKLQLSMLIFNKGHHTVLLDSSGMKIYGEGEWKVKIHGKGRPRKWVKVHIAVDEKTGEIVSECTTTSHVADSSVVKELLDKVPGRIKCVIADGAYDRKSVRDVLIKRKAKGLIPPPKNARYRRSGSDRDEAIAAIRGLGGDKEARSIWGKLSGYSRRALVESAFSRMKRLFGDRLFSKSIDKQTVENSIRCRLLNQMRLVG